MEVHIRNADFNDFDELIDIVGDYYECHNLNESITDKTKPPWSWISEKNIINKLILNNNKIIGFFIARNIPMNTHLHSFFIRREFRGQGFGKKLLEEHWKYGLLNNNNIDTFSLHVHSKNQFAANFYQKHKYKKIEQFDSLLSKEGGLGNWARNCKQKGQWPLREGIDLYSIDANKATVLCNNKS